MKLLLATFTLTTFIYVTFTEDAGEAMSQASKCGDDIRGEYARLCKKFDNNGSMLMMVEEKCVKTPEALSKFPVSGVMNVLSPFSVFNQRLLLLSGSATVTRQL